MWLSAAAFLVGGICGRFDNVGIIHTTANVTINTSDCQHVGGICGINKGVYNKLLDNSNCLYDCASNATITCNDTQNRSVMVGGIVGKMEEGENAYACVSMGSIKCTYPDNKNAIHSVGGVCGNLQSGAGIFACGSTMFIKSFGNVGGIVGIIKSTNPDFRLTRKGRPTQPFRQTHAITILEVYAEIWNGTIIGSI